MAGWTEFSLAFVLFGLAHALPARPKIRRRLMAPAGERGYLLAYSAVSLGLLYWLLLAAGRAPFVLLWGLAPWQLWVPNLVMPLVVLLAVAGIGVANPFSFGGSSSRSFDPERPGITSVSRHPLLLASGSPVVPFDLDLAQNERTLLVSGPKNDLIRVLPPFPYEKLTASAVRRTHPHPNVVGWSRILTLDHGEPIRPASGDRVFISLRYVNHRAPAYVCVPGEERIHVLTGR
jgi:hypothetical protein